jgi:hypothetical protein
MAGKKRKGKGKIGKRGRKVLVLTLGALLVLSAASFAVGVMNWMTRAYGDEITGDVRIEVLNGTGESGAAKTVARALMRRKIDVLYVGNADGFDYTESVLIARKKKSEVKSLGELLGCGRFIEQLKDDTMVDATLIIGADYRTLKLGLEHDSNLSE